jgi:hypothetical protein
MNVKHRTIKDGGRPAAVIAPDWMAWLRLIERKQRMLARLSPSSNGFPAQLLGRLTTASFRLEGLDVSDAQVAAALSAAPGRRPFRSRLSQRLRNHVAILRGIQRLVHRGESLKVRSVVRWYTSVSCGLSTASLDDSTMARLDATVRRISSPRLRLQPAVQEMAGLCAQWMNDPLVPSFNGILARLLLHYHLGRCGLPPVLFDPTTDRPLLTDEPRLLSRLMDLIDASYSLMLNGG